MFVLAGCNQTPQRGRGPSLAGIGGGREAVVLAPDPSVRLEAMSDASLAAATRRDWDLAVRSPGGALTAADQWPQAETPSLDQRLYIWLPKRADTALQFVPSTWQRRW